MSPTGRRLPRSAWQSARARDAKRSRRATDPGYSRDPGSDFSRGPPGGSWGSAGPPIQRNTPIDVSVIQDRHRARTDCVNRPQGQSFEGLCSAFSEKEGSWTIAQNRVIRQRLAHKVQIEITGGGGTPGSEKLALYVVGLTEVLLGASDGFKSNGLR